MAIRILYVDDEPDLREIAVMSLELDPDFDGPETAHRLRANPDTAQIPFVFISAQAQAADVERLMAEGAETVIAKPFDPATLAQVVRRLLPGTGG